MCINFWYPTAWAEELQDAPVSSKALGQSFVLFRDRHGRAHCLADTCVHRGGSLGSGKLKEDCILKPQSKADIRASP